MLAAIPSCKKGNSVTTHCFRRAFTSTTISKNLCQFVKNIFWEFDTNYLSSLRQSVNLKNFVREKNVYLGPMSSLMVQFYMIL